MTKRESVYCFFIHERGVGIRKAYFKVPGVGWESMDVQGVARMAEEVIERVERIAEELESLGASFESDVLYSSDDDDDDDDEDPDNLRDWLDDNLGVHYTINDDLDVVGVVICVDWGGPNIYVDTLQRVVRGYWGLDEHSVALSEDLCESIDDWAQDKLERAIASR